jgi:hypothetical protein
MGGEHQGCSVSTCPPCSIGPLFQEAIRAQVFTALIGPNGRGDKVGPPPCHLGAKYHMYKAMRILKESKEYLKWC